LSVARAGGGFLFESTVRYTAVWPEPFKDIWRA
jgi:hypothetical protein